MKHVLRETNNISRIFNWCLEGLRAYYDEGITPPQSVVEANEEYRTSSDKIGQFINDCLIKTQGKHEKASLVYEIYCDWCDECGLHALSKSNFFDELKSKNLMGRNKTVRGRTETNVVLHCQIDPSANKCSNSALF